jgi:hypothetical protein
LENLERSREGKEVYVKKRWKIKYADQSVNGTVKSANSITYWEVDYAP